jgi:hypothetical protein
MASRFANNDAQRSIKRMNGELNITAVQKDRIVNIATAHLAAGNVGDFTTALTAISRADTLNDVTAKLEAMEERQSAMIKDLKNEKTDVIPEAKPEWVQELLTRITALETK